MAYGLNPRLFVENGPALQASGVLARSSSNAFRAWRKLSPDRRLALIDNALARPANDNLADGYPAAL